MNISDPFIRRPVATILLTIGVALAGATAYTLLPVAPLPQVDFPTISVSAQMPGASPEVMANSVATPLERHLGQISDVTEMTSSCQVGSCRIILQFNLNRDINGAARDVQAAIVASRADLPANLRSNPTYRKINPADAPILILALRSTVLTQGQIYDAATMVFEQKLSQVQGVGQVTLGGSSLPAVRVELNPTALFRYGIGLEDVRAAISAANAHAPKGAIEQGDRSYQIYVNDQASKAVEYRNLIVAWRNGAGVRLSDLGEVVDSIENLRSAGMSRGEPSVLVVINRQPGANIIETVDRVKALLPQLAASIPSNIEVAVAVDRSTTIRASMHDIQQTLLISMALVILVVFFFLGNVRAALVPAVAVPVSLIGTFGVMYLLGYSLNNLSLMALTIASGFVVDDAIVVLENITRHIEAGMSRFQAALHGAREVSFTVLSMTLSLIAVFTPIALIGGIIGSYFREFAVTLSVAMLVSLAVSLTTTPMMCARLLERKGSGDRAHDLGGRLFRVMLAGYSRSLRLALENPAIVVAMLLVTIGLNVWLFIVVPKGFFPQQDTGRMVGGLRADQSTSFQAMRQKLAQFVAIVQKDPAVENIVGFTGAGGGSQTNSGFVFIQLKPLAERQISAEAVIGRLRRELAAVPGAVLFPQSVQDMRVGGRQSNAQFQYTLLGESLEELSRWTPRITDALSRLPELADVNSDQQERGLQTDLVIDRETAARLGIAARQIDNTLYDAFGQRQVSTIYNAVNQYHVVMEVAPEFWQSPEALNGIYVSTSGAVSGVQGTNTIAGAASSTPARGSTSSAPASAENAARNQAANQLGGIAKGSASTGTAVSTRGETMVPLSAFTHYGLGNAPLAVNHQGLFVATTISFNLPEGTSLGEATAAIEGAMNALGVPATIHGGFQGAARSFQQSISNQPYIIALALLAVYIVLGVLYESYVHPITILSTLPSAGVGAVLALLIFSTELSLIAMIGVILLIGIVKKNAIMMIDFALDAERNRNLSPRDAIYEACLLRFRPIMMTTMAALLGALPLAFGFGDGGELRRPLGISIVGGLIISQILTLYTTPVVYLYFDRVRLWARTAWAAPVSGVR